MKILLLSFFILISSSSLVWSQQDAWVFFTDKDDVEASINNPISILTQKAIDRKALHSVTIDERDVPVNETYITDIKSQTGITVLAKSKWMNCVHVRGDLDNIEALENLDFVASIEYADKSLTRNVDTSLFIKEDPQIAQTRVSYNYGATENQITMLNVNALHEQDYTGEGLTIAVMDSGFPGVSTNGGFSRLRDAGKLMDGYDFVDREDNEFAFTGSTHGARVVSDIAGFIEDQFVGTAPDVAIYCFRTEDVANENPVEESYWVEAAERADSLGVDIINTSLGYRTFDNPNYDYTYQDMDGETAFISRGATLAFEKGILVVTSAGNSGAGMISAPADASGAFTVGAVDSNGNYASFSSIGPSSDGRTKPDVVAKGQSSAVIDQNNNITTSSGTSFSSPIMAGAIASFWQANRDRSNEEVMDIIRESSSIFENPTPELGFGIPDFEEALGEVLSVNDNAFAKAETPLYKIQPNPTIDTAVLILPENISSVEVEVYDLLGKKVISYKAEATVTTIPISNLKSGIYLVQISDGQTIATQKLIKS